MTKKVVTVKSDDDLATVRELILEKRYHHLPVVDNGKLKGIVTSWDLFRSNIQRKDYDKHKVSEIMTTAVATLGPNEMIGAAAMVFVRHLFHGLPIVEKDGSLVGIVTTHDILVYQFKRENPNNTFIEETQWLESRKSNHETIS